MLDLHYDPAAVYEVPALTRPVTRRDHILGPVNAPLTLVEYGDYQCPFCGRAYPVVMQLHQDFEKRMRTVYRHFPLTQVHPMALLAAKAAEAAGKQGKFWEMHDVVFRNQESLSPLAFPAWAAELRLDMEQFERDLESEEVARRIQEDRRSGIASGVNGTPTFFINNRRFDGPPTYDALREGLLEALN